MAETKLPPGMVLDENGKPCKACNSWRSFAKGIKKQPSPASTSSSSGSSSASTASAALAFAASNDSPAPEPEPSRPDDCPPDVEQLGRSTWTFLHTTAAYYPLAASATQQSQMLSLLTALGSFYPCSTCAGDFRVDMKKNQPDVSGRAGLSRWLCERHNEVNEKLGKESFDCGKVGERWREGWKDGSCD